MKNYSIWKDSKIDYKYKKLDKDIECDILIIGGGITGISTLYHLKDTDYKVVLVEQNKIGMGVTANTTGKLTYLQENIYNKIIQKLGFEKASLYLESQIEAIEMAKKIIEDNKIECDLVKTKSYVYTNKDSEIEKIKELEGFLRKNNIEVRKDNLDLVKSKYMIGVKDTYHYNPIKFIDGLIKKNNFKNIYEDTSIRECKKEEDGYLCYGNGVKIRSKYVVMASHYPFFNIPFLFPIKGSLEKSYLCSGKKDIGDVSLISYSKPTISVRNYQDNIIYLSNSHNVCSKVNDKDNFKELEKKARDIDFDVEWIWSNIDIITNDRIPYIGKIDDNLYMATGYNTWGMTNGILAGYIISEMLKGNDNKYIDLFNPKRKSSGNILKILENSYYSALGMIQGLKMNEKITYQNIDGEDICIYKDSNDKEHKVYRKCPHMGCNLLFNEVEMTWDCPCHASRFDIDGKCISGPSNMDISYIDRLDKR